MGRTKETEIRVRHTVKTQALVEINRNLSPLQKKRLLTTPFHSLIDLVEEINISGVLLREVLRRWDTHSVGIRVGNRLISFSKLDVCFGLGLRIVGDPVFDDDRVDSRVKQLFDGEVINMPCIVKKMEDLTSDEFVEDFCRLYLLLAFATFYFPQTTRTINTLPFSLLDDLDSLHRYDWGGKVYNNLVGSLNRTAPLLNERKNIESVSIAGCAALLQIWTVEHLLLRPTPQNTRFPRFLAWFDVPSGKCIVGRIFESKKFVEVVALSEGDRSNEVLNEAIEEIERRYCEGIFTKEKEINIRLSSVEDKIKVYKTKDDRRASGSNEIGVSDHVPGASYAPTVANGSKATRDQNKFKKLLYSLYNFCTRPSTSTTANETLVRLDDHILTRMSLEGLAPRKWVDNLLFCFVSPMLMEEELERTGLLTRFLFNSFYAAEVIKELQSGQAGTQKRWTLRQHFKHVSLKELKSTPMDVLRSSEMIFAPACYNGHWVCYVVVQHERKMYVLDSLTDERNDSWLLLDNAMRIRFEELLSYVCDNSLETVYEIMPKQHNSHDCGIYVLKYLEFWNGEGTMPQYSEDDVLQFRQDFVLKWVLDPRNVYRAEVLEKAKVPQDLTLLTSL